MPTEAEILAAAKAIHQAVVNRSGRGRTWEMLPTHLQADFLGEARAALEAAEDATCGVSASRQHAMP